MVTMKKASLLKIVGAVAAINLLSRLLGFLREVLIGYHLGTSTEADSVITAFTIPNFLYMVVGGALTTAFISVYQKVTTKEKQELKEVIFSYIFVIFSVLSVTMILAPQWWIGILFPGLDDEEWKQTSQWFQMMGASSVFFVLSMYFSGVLNVHEKFRVSAVAPLINNALVLLVAILLFPLIGGAAYSWGVLLGSVVMAFILFRSIRVNDFFQPRLRWTVANKELMNRYLKIAVPILLGGATLQFYFLMQRVFASYLEDGLLAALNYSSKLVQLPQTVLMTAVTTVIYPLITKKMGEGKQGELASIYQKGISMLLFFMIPFSVLLYVLAEEVITVVYEYGAFSSTSTVVTAQLLEIFVIGMFAHAANVYVTRFFYAAEQAVFPVVSGILSVFGVNVAVVMMFIHLYEAEAVAWGTTIGAYVQLLILGMVAWKKFHYSFQTVKQIGQWFILVGGLYGVTLALHHGLGWIPSVYVQVIILSGLTLLVYVCFCLLLRLDIMNEVIAKLKRKGS
jgi:putative peptidoglycan lipid II flippase